MDSVASINLSAEKDKRLLGSCVVEALLNLHVLFFTDRRFVDFCCYPKYWKINLPKPPNQVNVPSTLVIAIMAGGFI